MAKSELRADLEKLRKQAAQWQRGQAEQSMSETAETPTGEKENGGIHLGDFIDLHEIEGRLGEFASNLGRELREVPASTALVIFMLGLLTGRLMSK